MAFCFLGSAVGLLCGTSFPTGGLLLAPVRDASPNEVTGDHLLEHTLFHQVDGFGTDAFSSPKNDGYYPFVPKGNAIPHLEVARYETLRERRALASAIGSLEFVYVVQGRVRVISGSTEEVTAKTSCGARCFLQASHADNQVLEPVGDAPAHVIAYVVD